MDTSSEGLNIGKLIPTSLNEQLEELVDGGPSNDPDSTIASSNLVDEEGNEICEAKNDKPHIGKKEEIPAEEVFNKYILTGYRINYQPWKAILGSIFQWHNETMNIWTHGLGFIIYSVLLLVLGFSQMGEDHSPAETVQSMH